MRRNQCILCGTTDHAVTMCPQGSISVDLRIGEWLTVYVLRRFGTISEAAKHYRISTSAMSMALAGTRPLPPQILRDAGVSFDVRAEVVKPSQPPTCTESQTAAEEGAR